MKNRINDVEELSRFCMKKDVDEIGEYLEKNYGAKFVDEWIDDGTEDEGVYVNGVAYRFPNGGIIDFFFGSDDRIISYVDTRRVKRLRENKQTVKLNESQLKKIVAESVKKVLDEHMGNYGYHDMEDLMHAITSLINPINDIRYYVRDENVQKAIKDFKPHFDAFAQAMRNYCDENGLVMNS